VRLLPFLLWVVLPTIIAISARYWFWRIEYIRKLGETYHGQLSAIDQERVSLKVPASGLTISRVRDADGGRLGEKIVLVHHLRGQAEDTYDFIRNTAVVSIILAGLLALNIATYIQLQRAATPGAKWYEQLATDTTGALAAIPTLYVAAIGNFVLILSQAVLIHSLRGQVRKYRRVLP
jgi:hypothetical protein